MATTYEEEKKRPDLIPRQTYEPPTNTATQQAQADIDAFYNTVMQRMAEAADPQRQAEQDAKIQRGRQFWTGGNLFANVIANAINANGTAKGAPSMTWNNEMEKNMYATWRDADRQLRADRQDAQRRYEAMGLQRQQMRLEAAKAQDAAAKDAYDINFKNANADIADQNKLVQGDYDYGRKKADDEAKEQRGYEHSEKMLKIKNAATAAENRRQREHQETMADKTEERQTKLALLKKGYDPDQKRVLVGNDYFKAENQNEAASHIWAVYEMLRNAYNADDGTGKARSAYNPTSGYVNATSDIDEATAFIGRTFRSVYKNNPAFHTEYDQYSKEYGASAAAKKPETTPKTSPKGNVR